MGVGYGLKLCIILGPVFYLVVDEKENEKKLAEHGRTVVHKHASHTENVCKTGFHYDAHASSRNRTSAQSMGYGEQHTVCTRLCPLDRHIALCAPSVINVLLLMREFQFCSKFAHEKNMKTLTRKWKKKRKLKVTILISIVAHSNTVTCLVAITTSP